MRVLEILAGLVALAIAGILSAYGLTRPSGPSALSASAERLRPGPYAVASTERTLVDSSRATPAHNDFAGAASRTLEATLYYPEGAEGPHPLVVYSHGFMSMRAEAAAYASHLASYGVVVIAADCPATNFRAPGGPNIADAVSQPGDVSFLIDAVTGWSEAERPFRGAIDPERVGAAGLSLGGFTSTVAAFHPTLRDPRIRAAVSIAGPSALFAPRFFEAARVPFLMIAGDADAIVDYAANAAPVPSKLAHGGGLLTIRGGSHAGFAPMASGVMRILGNPDRLGCWALSRNLALRPRENPFSALGGEEQGIDSRAEQPLPCANPVPQRAAAPGRQLMITTLALRAFFDRAFERDTAKLDPSVQFLNEGIARDFEEASYQAIEALPPKREREMSELPDRPAIPQAWSQPVFSGDDMPQATPGAVKPSLSETKP